MNQMFAIALLGMAAGLGGVSAGGDKKVIELDGLKSEMPAGWEMQKPSFKLRTFQVSVSKVEGDKENAELLVFYFGKDNGGSVQDNLKRWKGTFLPPDGKSIDDVSKIEEFKVGKIEITYLDVQGTFLSKNPPFDPNAKTEKKADYRRLGVFFGSENGPYFITLTGPARTIAHHKKAFDGWLKAFK